ncbi:MAG TPA: EF-P lysine aminoacylase EpmA [Steroidobacteraceae bacterium]|nr:EF-P lysine aminoacylase EpmA [Steroidobacteraceae bacterium]
MTSPGETSPGLTDIHWRPGASLHTLRLRAQLLGQVRAFFAARAVLEVDTPLLVGHAVTDPHLHCAEVRLPGRAGSLYLISSPEYAMKRLLAAGSGDIYQMSHVFRGDESGRVHNAEFMLIEWYRLGCSLHALMHETAQLAAQLLDLADSSPELVSYTEAFERHAGVDPLRLDEHTARSLARSHGLDRLAAERFTLGELTDWLMGAVIGPQLGGKRLCCLHHYPASQASLARLDPADARFALRFELYFRGVELANGFEELADPLEQRARFEMDQRERQARGLPLHAIDERLLAALHSPLPAAAGVALGFDRLLLLRTGAASLDQVMPFTLERA